VHHLSEPALGEHAVAVLHELGARRFHRFGFVIVGFVALVPVP
jgi:hypothetical protein